MGLLNNLTGDLSFKKLFMVLVGVSLLAMLGLSWSLLTSAKRADARLFASVEERLLGILREDGLSGLAVALDRIDQAIVPSKDRIEVAVWRRVGNSKSLIRGSNACVVAGLERQETNLDCTGLLYRGKTVDVGVASRDWQFQMGDVDLGFAIAQPTRERRSATRSVLTMALAYISGLVMTGLLYAGYWRRYRQSVVEMNALLNRYSQGETGLRIEKPLPAPELRELGRELNIVLPKIDMLFADLRNISAHLAHDLSIPLQVILSDVDALSKAATGDDRNRIKAKLDATIDDTHARLQSVLQLFRLQADSRVELSPNVAFGEHVSDLVYDMTPRWEALGGRVLQSIDEDIRVFGNAHLLKLVIENLLSNAEKYTQEHGEISIALEQAEGMFALEIVNDGELPRDLGDNAFERYARGEGREGKSGVGLGLSLVKAISDVHGFDVALGHVAGEKRVKIAIRGPVEEA